MLGSWTVSTTPIEARVALSDDGECFAVGAKDRTLRLGRFVSTSSGALGSIPVCLVQRGHEGSILSVAISPDKKKVVSGSRDNTIRVWNAEAGDGLSSRRLSYGFAQYDGTGGHLAFSPDGEEIVLGTNQGRVLVLSSLLSGVPFKVEESSSRFVGKRGRSSVYSVAYSPDGKKIAAGIGNQFIRLWKGESGELLHSIDSQGKRIYSVAFSPDGRVLFSGAEEGAMGAWDSVSGKELLSPDGHEEDVISISVSPDGNRIVSGSKDKTLRIWDTKSGELVKTLIGHDDTVLSAVFSLDGERIASGSIDCTVGVWDSLSGERLFTLLGHEKKVTSVAFNPDGERIISGSEDKTLCVWDTNSGELLLTLPTRAEKDTSVAISPDGKRIACYGLTDDTYAVVEIWETTDPLQRFNERLVREELERKARVHVDSLFDRLVSKSDVVQHLADDASLGGEMRSVARSVASDRKDNPKQLISKCWKTVSLPGGSPDSYQRALRWAEIAVGLKSTNTHDFTVLGVAQYRAGAYQEAVETLTVCDERNALVIGAMNEDDTTSSWGFRPVTGHKGIVHMVALNPDGTRIASGSADRTIRILDAHSGEEIAALTGHAAYIHTVSFSPDGTRIVSGSSDCTHRLWDVVSGRLLSTSRHERNVRSAAFSPDGKKIITVSDEAKVWNADTGEILFTLSTDHSHLSEHLVGILDAFFDSEGMICTVEMAGTLRIWDGETGEELDILTESLGSKPIAAVSQCGKWIAALGHNNTSVGLWSTRSGELVSSLEISEPNDFPWCMAFSPDSKMIAITTTRNTQIIDARTGQLLFVLRGHKNEVRSVAFSPDGERLISGSVDKTVGIWDLDTPIGGYPADVAFSAMALQRLGRSQEAEAALDRLRTLFNNPRWSEHDESRTFLSEAIETIEGNTESTK